MDTQTLPTPESHAFQAEVQQLLHIVVHSIYTDREVFVRELVSNAADALEKRRYEELAAGAAVGGYPLEISIETDDVAKTFTIRDTGIGMTREDLEKGLGTIAHSGTRAFLSALKEKGTRDVSLIGQFGVGFYSVFMVAERVRVETRARHGESRGWVWESDGGGTYTVSEREGLDFGTRIVVALKSGAEEFSRAAEIKRVLRRYSSFVPFPIRMGAETVNTLQAIWAKSPREVEDAQYGEFYKFISGTGEDPLYKLHFTAEAPLDLRVLLYVPGENVERFGLGKMTPQVDLYCRLVMIQKHPEGLLPDWMRFVRGVVDSEDLPLNISRESMQDSALLRRIASTVTSKFIRFLADQAKEDPEKYAQFHAKFGAFIKEGISGDFAHQRELAGLLRFETSATEGGKLASLSDYVARMKPEQKAIYFLSGPSREACEGSPYLDIFRARGLEVVFTRDAADDFVLQSLREFEGKRLLSADSPEVELDPVESASEQALSRADAEDLCGWIRKSLEGRIGSVRVSSRLVGHPGMIVGDGFMTNAMRRVMAAMGREEAPSSAELTLEINPAHPLIVRLHGLRATREDLARDIANGLLDNLLLGAGLMTEIRPIVERYNAMLMRAAGE